MALGYFQFVAAIVQNLTRYTREEGHTCASSAVFDSTFAAEQLSWVRIIARQVHRRLPSSVPFEDLVNAGVIGLLTAMRKYDSKRHVRFQCYAQARVRGAILDSLRESDWAPRTLRRTSRNLDQAFQELSLSLGRSPTEIEVARKVGMSLHQLQSIKRDLDALEVYSLDDTATQDSWCTPLGDRVAASTKDLPYNKCLSEEMRGLLRAEIAKLPDPARCVLVHYYFDEMTMKEIGAMRGISESRVSQIHAVAIRMLRRNMLESPTPLAAWRHPSETSSEKCYPTTLDQGTKRKLLG